ncbi:terminase large subunit protein [Rhizobium phage RHph_X2_26]|nr:terminase large subunit protein [Rhizobium phage RHph_X2_26]
MAERDERPALERMSEYARLVLDGTIGAGPHVRNTCQRHFDDLEHGRKRGIYFDEDAAQHVIDFFEEGLKLSDGQFDGTPLLLAPVQCFIVGSLFGWFQRGRGGKPDTRRFRRAYVEMGKGNGKSPVVGGIGLYGMIADGEASAQVYAAAANKDQASIMFRDAVKMVKQSPALLEVVTFSGGPGKEYNMAFHDTNSFFRPMSKEAGKTGSGLRPHFALCDEVHEHPDRSVMEMLERGFKSRLNPLLLMITNSGSDRNSICWEEHEHACKVAAGTATPDDKFSYVGEVIDDTTFSYVCAMDRGDDPLHDPSVWIKANPMLGVILSHEYLEGVAKQALAQPGKRNGILRLHFCEWTDSDAAWMAREQVEEAMQEFDPYEEHADSEVSLGVDLSASRDMTVVAHAVKTGEKEFTRDDGSTAILPTYDAWIEAFTPGGTLKERGEKDKAPYSLWVEKGYLHATEGERVRYDHVAHHIAYVHDTMKIRGIAYDRYAYSKLKEETDARGIEVDHVPHPQGGKNRAKPLEKWVEAAKKAGQEPPLGLWMPGSVKAVEEAFMDGRLRLRISPVLMTALMGATLERDAQENGWFVKTKATVRIDAAVALAMAIGLAETATPKRKKKKYQLFII